MLGVKTPEEAKAKIDEQKAESNIENPKNLEESAISLFIIKRLLLDTLLIILL